MKTQTYLLDNCFASSVYFKNFECGDSSVWEGAGPPLEVLTAAGAPSLLLLLALHVAATGGDLRAELDSRDELVLAIGGDGDTATLELQEEDELDFVSLTLPSLTKCIFERWCLYAPLDMNGVSQKAHLIMADSELFCTASLHAQVNAKMAPGLALPPLGVAAAPAAAAAAAAAPVRSV